jgi:HD-GYP domain-containing protein (c-di-GMP phosphodiesterase class II)
MYVSRLDRDWEGTPFPLQGVLIRSQQDIDALSRYCREVVVDITLGLAPPERNSLLTLEERHPRGERVEGLQQRVVYENRSSFEDEVPNAREARETAGTLAHQVLDDVQEGRRLDAAQVRRAVEPIVQSVLRNMDAWFWIESLRKRDLEAYHHALNCSALAAAFGRHMGFPEPLLLDLATGGLLLDIGKLRLPPDLFAKPGPLDANETALVRTHVELGLAIIQDADPRAPMVHAMLRTHHERHDGSGYPAALPEPLIPLVGRMAGVVDSYCAMTGARAYRPAFSQHVALQELYRLRYKLYGAEVVEQFLQCLGVYPTGSLVELSDGCVAIVMAQNVARRLFPKVMVLTGPDKHLAGAFQPLDLLHHQAEGGQLWISRPLPPGAYDLDPTELYL